MTQRGRSVCRLLFRRRRNWFSYQLGYADGWRDGLSYARRHLQ